MGELTGLPAIALAALVARREASAEEVVAAHLHRIRAAQARAATVEA
jgi:Asp-tRNA(Asn)/Glu-tRNA(Gln) amidotransferase A subunit family amidase